MDDLREKVINGLEHCKCRSGCNSNCPYFPIMEGHNGIVECTSHLADDALSLLKEQEVRELTMNEWREWKADSRRNPICMLWENDTSPIWILNPNAVHEPALLMGKLKLFTGKPTFEQCKAVNWNA